MMKTVLLVLKIGSLMAIIFACGIWVGRMTAPVKVVETVVVKEGSGGSKSPRMAPQARHVFEQYVRALELTMEQQLILEPLFVETGRRVAQLPRLSDARGEEYEKLHERMNPHLTPSQRKIADQILVLGQTRLKQRQNRP
ncbi:MAG: hypothetical protein Q7Q71_03750 [Verrucomicrobiota bacterium JB023]|nr:hypothetical protein [Verrucomicrobiota bacterium JB023]